MTIYRHYGSDDNGDKQANFKRHLRKSVIKRKNEFNKLSGFTGEINKLDVTFTS